MEEILLQRIEKLEKKQIRLKSALVIMLFSFILFFILVFSLRKSNENDIIKTKGLIIVDEKGKPRIILGAPINKLEGRVRTDNIYGISYLDSAGIDRLTFGQEPNPMTIEGLKKRRVQGVGVLLHDKKGIERGGYGVLDDEMAVLTLDWPNTGEAIALSSGKDFSGIGIFHKSKPGEYREALTIGNISSKKETFLKVVDTNYVDRFKIEATATQDVILKKYDKNGKQLTK